MKVRLTALIFTLTLALLGAPLPAETQQATRVARVGYLGSSSLKAGRHVLEAFQRALREHGWVEDKTLDFHLRLAEGRFERLPALAADLVGLKVDVIVAGSPPALYAAKNATTTIPIVMGYSVDPVGAGLVATLARPGGNITGLTDPLKELVGKWLQFLRELVPDASRVAGLVNPAFPGASNLLSGAKEAARLLRVRLQVVEAREASELDGAFAAMVRERAQGLLLLSDGFFYAERRRIAELALRHDLPSFWSAREYADAGGLITYAANITDMHRRAATFVDKILRGANPADLPIEQPTKFDFVLNLKTAKALGLTIPPSLLFQADRVIK